MDAAQEAASYRAELDGIRDGFNPLFAASRQYEAQLEAISAAEQLGAINAREAALAHDQSARALIALREAAETAGVPVRALGPAGQSAATGMQQLIDRLNGVRGSQQGATAAGVVVIRWPLGGGADDLPGGSLTTPRPIVTGAPIGLSSDTQDALPGGELVTPRPVVTGSPVAQGHALGGGAVTTGAPVITGAGIGQAHGISGAIIATPAPIIIPAPLRQRHGLAGGSVVTPRPVITGSPIGMPSVHGRRTAEVGEARSMAVGASRRTFARRIA